MVIETSRRDTAEFLDSGEAILAYFEAVFEDGDPELIALGKMVTVYISQRHSPCLTEAVSDFGECLTLG